MAIRSINEGPGRPLGPMAVRSTLASHTPAAIRAVLGGLPTATGYRVTVMPLRYRTRPHLVAFTFWDSAEMLIQVPEPFREFGSSSTWARAAFRWSPSGRGAR